MYKTYNIKLTRKMKTPKRIKAISIINYILAGITIIIGALYLYSGITFLTQGGAQIQQVFGAFSKLTQVESFYSLFIYIPIILGIIFLIISLLLILIGINLSKRKKWAYILEIIFGILWVIIWSIELFKGAFLNLIFIIPALIILYLLFTEKTRKFFRRE